MIWCANTEVYIEPSPVNESLEALEKGLKNNDPSIAPSMIYACASLSEKVPRCDNKEGWDNIDIFGWLGYPMQVKVDFLCRDSILAAPLALDLALFMDLAAKVGMSGIQEWLSFYFKSPMVAEGPYPEHDLFIQLKKLKNILRHMMGEELITHLGLEYYES
jgi:myo-inositol-1-phosphate synthase